MKTKHIHHNKVKSRAQNKTKTRHTPTRFKAVPRWTCGDLLGDNVGPFYATALAAIQAKIAKSQYHFRRDPDNSYTWNVYAADPSLGYIESFDWSLDGGTREFSYTAPYQNPIKGVDFSYTVTYTCDFGSATVVKGFDNYLKAAPTLMCPNGSVGEVDLEGNLWCTL